MERNPQEQINPATPEVAEELGSKAIELFITNTNLQGSLGHQPLPSTQSLRSKTQSW